MDEHNANPTSQDQQPPPYLPDMEPIDVQVGRVTPPGTHSLGIKGYGQTCIRGPLLFLLVNARRERGAIITALNLLYVSSFFGSLAMMIKAINAQTFNEVPVWLGLFFFNYVWYALARHFIRVKILLKIEPGTHACFYIKERRIACLQLPGDCWVAIRAKDKNKHDQLRTALETIYRGNVTLDDSRPAGNQPGKS